MKLDFASPVGRCVMRYGIGVFLLLGIWSLGCSWVIPSNAYDPESPPELQVAGSVVGRVRFLDESASSAALRTELQGLTFHLATPEGRLVVKADGTPITATTKLHEDENIAELQFSFLSLVPSVYTFRIDGVPSRYRFPYVPSVQLAPGGLVDTGALTFTSMLSEGPGQISGEVRLEGAQGEARRVELYKMEQDGPALYRYMRTGANGAFSFQGLPVGRYALLSTLEGFTPDHKLDVMVGEQDDAQLQYSYAGDQALTMHPVTAVILPTLPLIEGTYYTNQDEVPVSVLPFGGVTSMRLATNPLFTDTSAADSGLEKEFVPHSASATMSLPMEEGEITLYAQFEAKSESGFTFASPTFSTNIVRDVTPPKIIDAGLLGATNEETETYFLNGQNAAPTLHLHASDLHSAISGYLLARREENDSFSLAEQSFASVTSTAGSTQIQTAIPLAAGDGPNRIEIYVRDRAGNISEPVTRWFHIDTAGPVASLEVANATEGILRAHTAKLHVAVTEDEAEPVAMRIAQAPLSPGDVWTAFSPDWTLPVEGSHGAVVEWEMELKDAAGNVSTLRSAPVVLEYTLDVNGSLRVEGVPTLRRDHANVLVRLLRVTSEDETEVDVTSTDPDGAYRFTDVIEGSGYQVKAHASGYEPATQMLPELRHDVDLTVPEVVLRLSRGELYGKFHRADLQQSSDSHGGIVVSAVLEGGERTFQMTAVTAPDGTWRIWDVPVTQVGELWRVEGIAEGYGKANADSVEVYRGQVSLVPADSAAAQGPLPILLQPNSADFDLCAPTGSCAPLAYTNLSRLRARLRTTGDIESIRIQARVPFQANDAEPLFTTYDAQELPLVDVTGAEGSVDVYLQAIIDGVPGPVLRSSVVVDTTPPTWVQFDVRPSDAALHPAFTNEAKARVQIEADAGTGEVAPLTYARLAIAETAPTGIPAHATRCSSGSLCQVPFPTVGGKIEEKIHYIFGFACDLAGNCSTEPARGHLIYDRTPPSGLHGVEVRASGTQLVWDSETPYTRSPSIAASLQLGVAQNENGTDVLDEAGERMPDVFAYRLGLSPLLQGASVQILEGELTVDEIRTVQAPALPAEDGTYRVYAQWIDAAGNRSNVEPNPFSFPIVLDTKAPDAAFSLSDDAPFTNTTEVELSVVAEALDAPVKLWVTTDGGLFTEYDERTLPLAENDRFFQLPATQAPDGDGTHRVHVRFFDLAGNATDRQDSILLDRVAPVLRQTGCDSCSEKNGAWYSRADTGQVILDVEAYDSGSMNRWIQAQVAGGPVQTFPYGIPFAVVLPAEGANPISLSTMDNAGNSSTVEILTVILDRVAPTATLRLNDGDSHTKSADIVVQLVVPEGEPTPFGYRLSSTATFSGPLQTFVENLPLRLEYPNIDGVKTVFVELSDEAGNQNVLSASIVLDQTPPTGSISIDDGAAFTTERSVQVALDFPNDTVGYVLAENSLDCATATYETTTGTHLDIDEFSLSPGDGNKVIYVCYRDVAGNAALQSATIQLDESAPVATVEINHGATYTTSTVVELSFTAPQDISQMSIASSVAPALDCSSAVYEPYAASRSEVLPSGDGLKKVQVCFKDQAGNTTRAEASIVLDATAPTLTLVLEEGASHINALAIRARTETADDVIGLAIAAGASLDCQQARYEAYQSNFNVILSAGDGQKTLSACVKDAAGNVALGQASIVLDTQTPIAEMVVANGANKIGTRNTSVVGTVTEDVQYALGIGSLDCSGAAFGSTFVGTIPTSAVTLPAVSGTHRLILCVRDRAGNTASVSDDIVLDLDAPTLGFRVAAGQSFTRTLTNPIALTNYSSDIAQLYFTAQEAPSCETLDANAFAPLEAEHQVVLPAGDGEKKVYGCIEDDVGNRARTLPVVISLDTTAPTPASSLSLTDSLRDTVISSSSATRDAQPKFSWSAGTDAGSGIRGYRVELSSDSFATIELSSDDLTGLKYFLAGELADRTWYWRVQTFDRAGNSTASDVFSFNVDQTPPLAPRLQPLPAYANTDVQAAWDAADDDTDSYRVELRRGAQTLERVTQTTRTDNRIVLRDGVELSNDSPAGTYYQLRVYAVDAVGNVGPAAVQSFYFDDRSPCHLQSAGPELSINNNKGVVDGVQYSQTSTVLVRVTCSGEQPEKMSVSCDGTSLDDQNEVAFQEVFTCAVSTLQQGEKTIRVRLLDRAGNRANANDATIFWDDKEPSTPRFDGVSTMVGTAYIDLPALSVPAQDPEGVRGSGLATPTYRLEATNESEPLDWDGTSTLRVSLQEGANLLRVRARDRAGNVSGEDYLQITRDTERPVVSDFTVFPGNGDVTIQWTTDAEDIENYLVYYGPAYGSDITAYSGTNADQGFSPIRLGNQQQVRLTGLPNGTPLYVAVQAVDKIGAGPLKTKNESVTPYEVPLVRASVTTMAGVGKARAVTYADGFAFIAVGCEDTDACDASGLLAYDLSAPEQPVEVGAYRSTTGIGARVLDVQILGSWAFLSDGPNLRVFDISNPTQITLLNSYAIPDNYPGVDFATALALQPGMLYVSAEHEGLLAYGISEVGGLTLKGTYNPTGADEIYRSKGRAISLAVQGHYAYVGGGDYATVPRAVEVVDVSDPSNMTRSSSGSIRSLTAWDTEFHGSKLYFAQNLNVRVHELPNGGPTGSLFSADAEARASGQPKALTVAGPYLYVFDNQNNSPRLRVLSTAVPATSSVEMEVVGQATAGQQDTFDVVVEANGSSYLHHGYPAPTPERKLAASSRLKVVGNLLLDVNRGEGLVVYRIGQPHRIREVAHLLSPTNGNAGSAANGSGFGLLGRNLIQAGRAGVAVLNLSSPAAPEVLGVTSYVNSHHVLRQTGDTLYLTGRNELKMLRASAGGGTAELSTSESWILENVGTIPYQLTNNTARYGVGLYVRWPYAYVVTSTSTQARTNLELQVLNLVYNGVDDVVALPDGENYRDASMAYANGYLLITRSTGPDVTLVDISDPSAPVLAGSISSPDASGVVVQGLQLFVGSSLRTRVYDLSAGPSAASLLGTLNYGGATPAVSGDLLFTAGQQSTSVVRVSDPTDMKLLARTGRLAIEHGVFVVGKHIFAQDRAELSIIEMQ